MPSVKNSEDLLAVLSNPKRRQTLKTLSHKAVLTDQETSVTAQDSSEVKRHLRILEKSGLIEEDADGGFSITHLGYACLQSMGPFEFLGKHRRFFGEHTLGDVECDLLARIGDLENSEFFYGIHIVFPKWSKIVCEAEQFLNLIFLHPPILIADAIKPALEGGLHTRLLIGRNSVITDCNEFVDRLSLQRPTHRENFEKRMAELVQVNLVMSEKEACVIFPNNDGITDMHGNFISGDPDFVRWCDDFFRQKWSNAEPLARIR